MTRFLLFWTLARELLGPQRSSEYGVLLHNFQRLVLPHCPFCVELPSRASANNDTSITVAPQGSLMRVSSADKTVPHESLDSRQKLALQASGYKLAICGASATEGGVCGAALQASSVQSESENSEQAVQQ